MFALHSRRLRRRLTAPTSGSARRRARERQRAQQTRAEGERLALERREQRRRDKMEQQRLAREQLASYEPWGRAGGGAPNPHGVRFTNLRASGIYPEDELRGVNQYEACRRWPSPRRRRRLRTPLQLRLREDPQTLYTDTLRKSVDNDIRYRQTPEQQKTYKEILDDMVSKKHKAMKDEMKRDLEYERKMQTIDGPWGKPGPGGTTWRNPRDIGLNFSKSMGWTDNEIFNKMKGDHRQLKRSSLTLPKVKRDDDLGKENIKPSSVDKLPNIQHNNCVPSGNSREQSRKNSYEKKDEHDLKEIYGKKDGLDVEEIYGNGKSKKNGKKEKFIKRLPNGTRLKRIVPDDCFKNNNNTILISNGDHTSVIEKKLTPEETILGLTGGIELVPLLARRRRVGARTLPSSDVTRPPEQSCQWRESLQMEYLRELKRQMQIKYERKEVEECRLESAESVRRHHATFESIWGRPGHGAPLRGKYARNNLARLLYVPLGNAS